MKTKIQIKSIFGNLLFEFEKEDNTIKDTLIEAVARSADLRYADLSYANLSYANLSYANLSSANLSYADLSYADLRSADLRSADLSYANLRSADLNSAEHLPESFINLCSRDMLFVFQHLKGELPFLREKLVAGKVNGTQYEGECACLIGTLGKADGGVEKVCGAIPYYDKGLHNFGEQWFWNIREGDTPETNQFAAHALKLIDSVLKVEPAAKKRGRPRKS